MTSKCNLVDIQDIRIDPAARLEEKAISFIQQIKDPYHFRFGKYEVEVAFVGNERLEDKLISYLSNK